MNECLFRHTNNLNKLNVIKCVKKYENNNKMLLLYIIVYYIYIYICVYVIIIF